VGGLQVRHQQNQHRGDHGAAGGEDRGAGLAGGCGQVALFPVAVDEEEGVVGARSEDEDEQEHRSLRVDDDRARLDQQVGDPDCDQVGEADDEQREEGEDRGPVDGEKQEEDEAEGGDQQGAAGVFGDRLEVGGDPARPGDVGVQPRPFVRPQVAADGLDSVDDRAPVLGVDRQHQ
jgi:hypothetical protein